MEIAKVIEKAKNIVNSNSKSKDNEKNKGKECNQKQKKKINNKSERTNRNRQKQKQNKSKQAAGEACDTYLPFIKFKLQMCRFEKKVSPRGLIFYFKKYVCLIYNNLNIRLVFQTSHGTFAHGCM